jgi:hypothetical protein
MAGERTKLMVKVRRMVPRDERRLWVEAVCKRDPLMLLGLGMATRLKHPATFERSPGRRLGPHRLQERLDAEDCGAAQFISAREIPRGLEFR